MIRSEFYIYFEKYNVLTDKSVDWFIKSWKYKYGSNKWQLCRLKSKIYEEDALEYLKLSAKELNKNGKS